jgi:hypothetical protein
MKPLIVALSFLLAGASLSAEDLPVLLLFPLQAEGVEHALAEPLAASFEEALVQSGVFRVIDSEEISLLLRAQELMFSDAFAESDALTVGALLPADLVCYVRASARGGGIFLQAKIMEAGTGRVVSSESATAEAGQQSKAAVALARVLCGLTPENEMTGAASLTITADRDGAVVRIDGRVIGATPLLVDPIVRGNHFVEVSIGDLFFSASVDVNGNARIHAGLVPRFGSLIISTTPAGARVRIDDTDFSAARFIEKLSARTHRVYLDIPGLHWKGDVPVLADKTVKISVTLQPAAEISVSAGPNTSTHISGEGLDVSFDGGRTLADLSAGKYVVESSRNGFQPFRREVDLAPGQKLGLTPDLTPTLATEESKRALEAELSGITDRLASSQIPDLYLASPVPDMDTISVQATLFPYLPVVGFVLPLFPPPLPPPLDAQFRTITTFQGFLGLIADACLGALFFVRDDPWKTGLIVGAGAGAAGVVILGAVFGPAWSQWAHEMRGQVEERKRDTVRAREIEAALADLK